MSEEENPLLLCMLLVLLEDVFIKGEGQDCILMELLVHTGMAKRMLKG